MFEKEIEFIYKYNLNKIKHLGSFITYEQLVLTNLHPALLQYLSAEIDFLIFEDRQKLLKDSLFDYSGEKITEYFAQIGEEIKRTRKFSIEYLSKLLLHAASFNANFIIRPKWSLMQFVFENENELSKQITEVKQILNYLYYYPYLKRLLINFFDKKRMISITHSEFEELLDKIDKISFDSNFDKVLDNAFLSMAEFIYAGEISNRKISKQFVELYLVDKGLKNLKAILDNKFGIINKNRIDISEFKNALLNPDNFEKSWDYNSNVENDVFEEKNELSNVENSTNNEIEAIEDEIPINENTNIYSENLQEKEATDFLEEPNLIKEAKKSFLESHIEKIEDEAVDFEGKKEQVNEPPEMDEERRVDENNINEIYDFVTEEDEINVSDIVEDSNLSRLEIDDYDTIDILEEEKNAESTKEELLENDEQIEENGFVKIGNSIKFSFDESDSKLDEKENIPTIEENDGWVTESSNNEKNDFIPAINEDEENLNSVVFVKDETSEIMTESEKLEKSAAILYEEIAETENIEIEPMLFSEEELEENELVETENEGLFEETVSNKIEATRSIDISVLLDNKKIPKIIEVVFDYDMEDFAKAIEEISESKSEEEALKIIDNIASKAFLDKSIKELKLFKSIISEFFK